MMKMKLWLALPAIAGAIAFAQPAAAAVVSYTYTGVVDFGADDFGLFGQAGASLTGKSFTATFYRDDAFALPEDIFQGEVNSYVIGAQAVRAVLQIDGVAFEVAGNEGQQAQYDDGTYEGFEFLAGGLGSSLHFSGTTLGTFGPTDGDVLASADYHTLTSLDGADLPGFDLFGTFEFVNRDAGDLRTFANFNPTALVVSPNPGGGDVGAVPEPATWAMMIAGFGGVGWTLRRRRGMAAFA